MMNKTTKSRALKIAQKNGLYIFILALIAFFALNNSKFFSLTNMLAILQGSVAGGILTVGMIFVLITGGVDISVGSIMYAGVIAFVLSTTRLGVSPLIGILFAIATGAVFGLFNGWMIGYVRILPFVATLATMGIARGAAQLACGGKMAYLEFLEAVCGNTLGIPNNLAYLLLVLLIGQYILSFTRFGRHLYAIGNDEASARKMGINVAQRKLLVYMIAGICAAIAGCLNGIRVGIATATYGEGEEFTAISAAVIGGTSLFGGRGRVIPCAVVGIILFQMIFNGLVMMGASAYTQTIFRGAVILLVVLTDSIQNGSEILH